MVVVSSEPDVPEEPWESAHDWIPGPFAASEHEKLVGTDRPTA